MTDYYSYTEISEQFSKFINDLGIYPDEYLDFIADGRIHRFKTKEDDAGQTSGCYILHTDNIPSGYVQDWRKRIKENWKFKSDNPSKEKRKFNVEEFNKESKKRREEREKQLQQQYNEAAENARIRFEQYKPWNEDFWSKKNFHPYLQRKDVYPYNARIDSSTGNLVIPLYDIDGKFTSLQWINNNGRKKFFPKATTKGVFCNINNKQIGDDDVICIGEGFATMAKVYELTLKPCIAAMNCGNLIVIAAAFRKKYPNNKIIIIADDDKQTESKIGYNPGVEAAREICNANIANGFVTPPFESPEDGTDWDDYAIKYGNKKAEETLERLIRWHCMSKQEQEQIQNERKAKEELVAITSDLDPKLQLPQQEFVGGIFPKKFVTIIAAAPGTGKTMLMQRIVSDLSVGGTILGGVSENEPERRALIFAGEAGRDMLIRRAASFKWNVKPSNVKIVDQHRYELANKPIMLDDTEGINNVERLIQIYSPDIIYWDTFSSFHDRDENKATEIKPLIRDIATLADKYNFAAVLNHHSRKRIAKDRNLSLNQDDVIGSSIFNRLAALIIGIEKDEDELDGTGKVLKVRPLKTWFKAFSSFNFTLEEGYYGSTIMNIDLNPKDSINSRDSVWNYLVDTFRPGEWFSRSSILMDEIIPPVSLAQLKRNLSDFVQSKRLNRRGQGKNTEYSIN